MDVFSLIDLLQTVIAGALIWCNHYALYESKIVGADVCLGPRAAPNCCSTQRSKVNSLRG